MNPIATGLLATALMAALACGAARADTNVSGWEVSNKPDKGVCTAARDYKDAADNNKENAVAFGLVRAGNGMVLVVNFSYEDWTWDKSEDVKADLLIDGEMVLKQAKWVGDKQGLTATFDQSGDILSKFGNGKKVVLHFDNGDAEFDTPNAGMAIGAVQQCLDAK